MSSKNDINDQEVWCKKSEEQEKLVNLINFHGFVLEDMVGEIIRTVYPQDKVKCGDVFHRPGQSERVEIDVWVKRPSHYFIFEVKTSAYDWVFLRGPNTDQHFHIMSDDQQGLHTTVNSANARHPLNSKVTEVGFEVLSNRANGSTLLETSNSGKKVVKDLNLPIGSENREIIRPATKQLLKNLETLAHHEMFNVTSSSPRPTIGRIFLPFLVTNAPLFVASYERGDISDDGSLKSLSMLESVPWAVYNYPEILRWDSGLQQQVKHAGWYYEDPRIHGKDYSGSHLKSVFVVQYQQLDRFLRKLG